VPHPRGADLIGLINHERIDAPRLQRGRGRKSGGPPTNNQGALALANGVGGNLGWVGGSFHSG
jgi:hypothetical protein